MAPPPSTVVSPVVTLMLRVLTFIFLLISLIILATNNTILSTNIATIKIRFSDVYAYKYMLFTILIGLAYTLLQTLFTIYQMSTGNRLGGDCLCQFDFYADKLMSYILATGAAAGFGATIDLKSVLEGNGSGLDHFFNKGNAAASLLLLGFLCTAVLSILSSLALPKRGY
ncbi:CASP-like protein 4D1 [Camellia lanceoleosa]|uniref:CASP-like protein 4D1 n=1 Tax=Camellia lanceoleosa TaxID=1840588 RepID=A0ACC0IYI6_9ERIC|nr:CASP-like protein 4D1 [Camellia lanceoleosa]